MIYSFVRGFITRLLPIKPSEVGQYLLISCMLFCFLFMQDVLRNLKDTVSVNLIGAEANNFYKSSLIPGAVILVMWFYTRAVARYNSKQIFYYVISIFLAWYFIFGIIIFPNREYFCWSDMTVQYYLINFPNLKWYIEIFAQWPLGIFYITCELWQSLFVTIVVWQFIMNILTIEQSQRMFLSFSMISKSSLIFSGLLMKNSTYILSYFNTYHENNIDLLVNFYIKITLLFGITGVGIFYFLANKYVTTDIFAVELKANKKHDGIVKSFLLVISSTYMLLIGLTVFAYGSTINIIESQWKKYLYEYSSSIFNYFENQADMLFFQGVLTVGFAIVGANLVKFGWTKIAIIPALLTFFMGISYFYSIMVLDVLVYAYQIGFMYMIMIKSSKYALLDNTKEMAFKVLDIETQTKGKGSIDLIANKYGKALSSLMYTIIFIVRPDLTLKSPEIIFYIMLVFFIIVTLWLIAVVILGQMYNKKLDEKIA